MHAPRSKTWVLLIAATAVAAILALLLLGPRSAPDVAATDGRRVTAANERSHGAPARLGLAQVRTASELAGAARSSRAGLRKDATIILTTRISPSGALLKDAPVCLIGRGVERGFTDDLGVKRFQVTAGEYLVGVDPPVDSMTMGMQLTDDAVGALAEAELSVEAGSTHDVTLYVQSASFLTGRLLDSSGSPVFETVPLRVVPVGPAWMEGCTMVTDTNGYFETKPLFAGSYVVVSRNETGPLVAPTEVELGLGERRSITLDAWRNRPVQVTVRVRSQPSGTLWPLPVSTRFARQDALAKTTEERKVRYYPTDEPLAERTFEAQLRTGPYEVTVFTSQWAEAMASATQRLRVKRTIELKPDQTTLELVVEAPEIEQLAVVRGQVAYAGDELLDFRAHYVDSAGEEQAIYVSVLPEPNRYALALDLALLGSRTVQFFDATEDDEVHIGTLEVKPGEQTLDLRAAGH